MSAAPESRDIFKLSPKAQTIILLLFLIVWLPLPFCIGGISGISYIGNFYVPPWWLGWAFSFGVIGSITWPFASAYLSFTMLNARQQSGQDDELKLGGIIGFIPLGFAALVMVALMIGR